MNDGMKVDYTHAFIGFVFGVIVTIAPTMVYDFLEYIKTRDSILIQCPGGTINGFDIHNIGGFPRTIIVKDDSGNSIDTLHLFTRDTAVVVYDTTHKDAFCGTEGVTIYNRKLKLTNCNMYGHPFKPHACSVFK